MSAKTSTWHASSWAPLVSPALVHCTEHSGLVQRAVVGRGSTSYHWLLEATAPTRGWPGAHRITNHQLSVEAGTDNSILGMNGFRALCHGLLLWCSDPLPWTTCGPLSCSGLINHGSGGATTTRQSGKLPEHQAGGWTQHLPSRLAVGDLHQSSKALFL